MLNTILSKELGSNEVRMLEIICDMGDLYENPFRNDSKLTGTITKILNTKKERRNIEISSLDSKITKTSILNMDVLVQDSEMVELPFDLLNIHEELAFKGKIPTSLTHIPQKDSSIVRSTSIVKQTPGAIPMKRKKEIEQPESPNMDPEEQPYQPNQSFMSAREKFISDNSKLGKKILGVTRNNGMDEGSKRRGQRPAFVSPLLSNKRDEKDKRKPPINDDRLKNVDANMVEMIMNEIIDNVSELTWDDIAGLDHAKSVINEIVVWPMLRPDIFNGIRGPPKGLLLFGPPGTGKTLIGKCIANQCSAKFFSISSSSLTSKWVGEGEKMVRALFAVARVHQPSVIFVDEIDSLLTQRTDGEMEATRRIKTEFLVQFDGCGTSTEDRILLIGATNRPHEIDEAARRRFRKKLYIPLPDAVAREAMVRRLLSKQVNSLTDSDIKEIVEKTDGYSGSDMDGLVRESALGPIRDIVDIASINANDVRGIEFKDFLEALDLVKASVSNRDLDMYSTFEREFGSVNKR